jgi:monoamine oxidase
MTDAAGWLPQPEDDRVRIALRDLQSVYRGQVDVAGQFIEAFDVNWAAEEPTGDAMFFPGQFKNLFNVARQPEGDVYFAGEHLSVHHTWIVGALDSAMLACQQMLGMPDLAPFGTADLRAPAARRYDYEKCVHAPTLHELE